MGSERPVLAEEIERVVTPVVAAHRLILVDVDLRGGGRRSVLRVFVEVAYVAMLAWPTRARAVRHVLTTLSRMAYYLGVPAWLVVRLLAG